MRKVEAMRVFRSKALLAAVLLMAPFEAGAEVLAVDLPGSENLERPVGILLSSSGGRVPVHLTEAAARQPPADQYDALAGFLERQGFELAAPLTGEVVINGGELIAAQFSLVLLRRRAADGEGDEYFDVDVSGRPSGSESLLLEACGFSRTKSGEEPDFCATFEARIEP